MSIWLTLVLIVHVVAALGICGLVLLQHGKGADMGAAFGGGASGSLFGATGSANFLSRATAILAVIFFLTSLGLTYLATHRTAAPTGVMDRAPEPSPVPTPSTPAQAPTPAPAGDNSIPVPQGAAQSPKSEGVTK
jgi:preprotein translocase subunit SecG